MRFWLCLLLAAPCAAQTVPAVRVAVLPFVDKAGFQGDWDLSLDVPMLLVRYLEREPGLQIVEVERVAQVLAQKEIKKLRGDKRVRALAQSVQADAVVLGVVEKFGVRRMMAGDPNLVGYKSYTHTVKIGTVDVLQSVTGQLLATCAVHLDSVESPRELDLFGRPRAQDREFRELFKVVFASPRFFELAFGQLVDRAFSDLSGQITRALVNRPAIVLSEKAVVLAVEGAEVFLGLGLEDRVHFGDVLPVLRQQQRIALVQVRQVLGPHLSKGIVLQQQEPVKNGLRLGQRLSPGE